MSLDDTLHARFEALALALTESVAHGIETAREDVRAAMDEERRLIFEQAEQTARAAADLRAAADKTAATAADVERIRQGAYDEGFDAGRTDGWDTGRQHGAIEGRHDASAEAEARLQAASQRLVSAIRDIDAARTVPDTLEALLQAAASEAARAALLLVRGSELQGWKFVAFGARSDNPTEFRQEIVGSGVIEEAIRTRSASWTHGEVRVPAPAFAELPLGRRAIAVPIVILGRVVAVLFADQGPTGYTQDVHAPHEGPAWPAAIEILTRHASRCMELSTALKSAQSGQSSQSSSPTMSAASPRPVAAAQGADR
jgi:hypothetical protein